MFRIYILFLLVALEMFAGYAQTNSNSVKIGLLISDKKSVAARDGAELAIAQANGKGGYNGIPFELVTRSMEGPWGTGAKEAVNLIFTDRVCAILGSTDGRNAHLVEQAATKSRVVFLSAWSGDPTLSQAFVPWFFTCVPNNNQQASALFDEIYQKKDLNPVGIVADQDYDSQSALKSFLKKVALAGKPEPLQFSFQENGTANQLIKANLLTVVLFVKPSAVWKLTAELAGNKNKLQVFAVNMSLNENELPVSKMNSVDGQPRVCSEEWINARQQAFSIDYQKKFGEFPGAVAAFAYDGMNLLIEAVRKGGLERENIQSALTKVKTDGVTGTLVFDEKGNRRAAISFNPIKNGIPAISRN